MLNSREGDGATSGYDSEPSYAQQPSSSKADDVVEEEISIDDLPF